MSTAKAKNGKPALSAADLRERIRAQAAKSQPFEVGDWDTTVHLRSMTVQEKSDLADGAEDSKLTDFLPRVIMLTCYSQDGERLFTDDDLDWLAGQPAATIEPLALAGMQASGMDTSAVESGKGAS